MHDFENELDRVVAGLKDFQRATVQWVFHRLFSKPKGRMLVADEVGLGKTIVAKGVIAEAVRRHLARKSAQPFQVAYICSNQAIAQENQQKLQLFKSDKTAPMYGRISELAYAPPETNGKILDINSLTPATSFSVTQGAGNWVERLIVFRLLRDMFPEYEPELKVWSRAWVEEASWEYKLASERGTKPLRQDLPDRFRILLDHRQAALSEQASAQLELSHGAPVCLWRALKVLLEKLRARKKPERAKWELLVQMRRTLVECCIEYIHADLYILDEFQRFRVLLEEREASEEARIAKRIFSKPEARILLLSATPFKAFSGENDHEIGEAHHQELQSVLKFLAKDDPGDLLAFESARREIYTQMAKLGEGSLCPAELCDKSKIKLESLLSRYICRTERAIAAGSGNLMLQDSWRRLELPITKEDIETFRAVDRLARLLAQKDLAGKSAGGVMDYAKSAAFPLSYLDGYQFKEQLRNFKDNPKMQKALRKSRCAWLNEGDINRYAFKPCSLKKIKNGGGNARLKQLIQESVGDGGHLLLWVPPSLPYYQLSGPFRGQARFSKTLVFSSWQLVPRMIGTLVSYEVERRTIGADKKIKPQNLKYFHGEKQRRHPRPQLKFRTTGDETGAMSLFTLLYPCQILAGLVDAELFRGADRSFKEIKDILAARIAGLLKAQGLQRQTGSQRKSQAWYWGAPFLLDQEHGFGEVQRQWVERDGGLRELKQDHREMSALGNHFHRLKASLETDGLALGEFPENLPAQLAIMALGSPAVACLRALRRRFPNRSHEQLMVDASQLAAGFLELFNKPEAISAVRLGNGGGFFWQQVLLYCAQGCIHAMVDEYLHMLLEQVGTLEKAKDRFLNSINMFTTSVNVESLRAFTGGGKPKKMRCHYAVAMGSQKIETEGGRQRVVNIRESFNSPFRPFVLASTSIGQEGLDFHWYCRKIVHWNLPGNPIDLEQREGRINRYKSLVIRRRIASRYGANLKDLASKADIWSALMALAEADTNTAEVSQLQPFWHLDGEEGAEAIERLVPLYPFSKDVGKLEQSLKILTLYRLTFGQPRQDELLNYLLKKDFSAEEISLIKERLLINLSPLARGNVPPA